MQKMNIEMCEKKNISRKNFSSYNLLFRNGTKNRERNEERKKIQIREDEGVL